MHDRGGAADAARALAKIGRRHERAIRHAFRPVWYWWTIGAQTVALTTAVENLHGLRLGITVVQFVVGVVSANVRVVVRMIRGVPPRDDLVDTEGIVAMLVGTTTFVAVAIGASLAVGSGLKTAGVPHPAIITIVVTAVLLAVGGPMLMRYLTSDLDGSSGKPGATGPAGCCTLPMPCLRLPAPDMHASFVEAMAEFRAEGRGGGGDNSMVGHEIRDGGWHTPEGFARFIAALHADSVAPRREGWVACTTWWWCEGSTYLGRIALRHELNARLRVNGGHIGYDVRPTARRRGHATAMLAAALPHARRMDIRAVLVTCDADNVASRRVIEANGGVLEDESAGTLRYWISV